MTMWRINSCGSVPICLLLLILRFLSPGRAQDTCGIIGSLNKNQFIRNSREDFFLNTDNPAPCNGSVTKWFYCHYPPSDTSNYPRETTFAIFRRPFLSGWQAPFFTRVSVPFRVEIQALLNPDDRFECRSFGISSPIPVQQGDVVGACVYDFGGSPTRELNIIGSGAPSNLTLQTAGRLNCRRLDELIPMNVTDDMLSTMTSKVMHLYADIECPVTTTEEPTTSSPTSETTFLPKTSDPTDTTFTVEMTTLLPSNEPAETDTEQSDTPFGFTLEIVGVIGGLVVSIIFIVITTVCVGVCYIYLREKSDNCKRSTSISSARVHVSQDIELRRISVHSYRSEGSATESSRSRLASLRTHRSASEGQNSRSSRAQITTVEDEPVYTIVNKWYVKASPTHQEVSNNCYAYANVTRTKV